MKKITYILLIISCLLNCKQTAEHDEKKIKVFLEDSVSNNIQEGISKKENVKVVLDNDKKSEIDCTEGIYFDNVIPTFNFQDVYSHKRFNKTFLIDTLFQNFYASRIETNIQSQKNQRRNYLEFSKYYDSSANIDALKRRDNVFGFYTIKEKGVALEYVEINFPTRYYRNVKRDLFKIKKDTSLIDIGISKEEFALIFEKDAKALCDTIKVGDDSSDSYYIFKDGILNKMIFNFYTP